MVKIRLQDAPSVGSHGGPGFVFNSATTNGPSRSERILPASTACRLPTWSINKYRTQKDTLASFPPALASS